MGWRRPSNATAPASARNSRCRENQATTSAAAKPSTMSSTSVVRAVQVTPTTSTKPYLGANCYINSYDVTRAATGELTWKAQLDLADGALPTWTNS